MLKKNLRENLVKVRNFNLLNHIDYKRKFDKFLKFFQRFIHSNSNISMDLDFIAIEILENIRPTMKIYKNFEEADQACNKILQREEHRYATGAKSDEEDKSDDEINIEETKIDTSGKHDDQNQEQDEFDEEFRKLMEESLAQGREKRTQVKPNNSKTAPFMKIMETQEK